MLAARLARRLRDRCRFVFACLDEVGTLGEQLRQEGFPVTALGRKPGLDLRCAWRLGSLLREHRVEVLNAHQYTPFFYALMARFVSRRYPILFTEHGRHQPDYPRRKRIVANRLLLGRRDRVVAVGEAVRQALIDNEGIPRRRIEVVYNGIDTSVFGSGQEGREATRRELGLGGDELAILQVARLDYLKDHLTAVRTMARVVRQTRARLLLAGEGPEGPAIRDLVEREGLQDRVVFLGLRGDVARLMHAADIFLLTSVSEGIPLTILEAMAAGLPVVSTHVGGTGEVVTGETGFLAPARDDAALADALLRLAADPALRQRLGEAGRHRARMKFDEQPWAERHLAIYQEMVRG
jgi:glycosyltransferase involved in cell wall biosynthesis